MIEIINEDLIIKDNFCIDKLVIEVEFDTNINVNIDNSISIGTPVYKKPIIETIIEKPNGKTRRLI